MEIELVILLVMLGSFLIANMYFKLPVSLSMMVSAILGIAVCALWGEADCSNPLRHLFEGTFTYLDTILIIATAMIFMQVIQESGAMSALNTAIVTTFYKVPAIMLILLMLIVMFPAMVTGSSTAAVLSAGVIVAPVLLMIGVPKEKTGAIIAIGAILGMAAPPVNVPALLIGGGVDMPYIGFEKPLFFITIVSAVFTVLFLALKYCKNIDIEKLKDNLDTETGKKYGFKLYIPIIVLVILLIGCRVWPNYVPNIGMPLTFLIAAIIGMFTGKKVEVLKVCKDGIKTTIPVLAKLIGVGMFIQVLALTGARAWIVVSCLTLSAITVLFYLAICVVCPAFGAVSSYGSASVLGVPFLLALVAILPSGDQTVMAAALSCIVCTGDLMPPTALAGNYAASLVESKYPPVLKHCVIPMIFILVLSFLVLRFSGSVFAFLG